MVGLLEDQRGRSRKEIPYLLGVFLLGLGLRAIPELLSPYPVGYDTPFYVASSPHLHELELRDLLRKAFLLPAFLWFLNHFLRLDLLLAMRVLTPALYGLLMSSFYFFLRRGLDWPRRKSLFCTVVCSLQPASLRISWDLFKNELGLVMLFLFLVLLRGGGRSRREWFLLGAVAFLVVLSHQLASVMMFASVLAELLRSRKDRRYIERLMACIAPASLLFSYQLGVFVGLIPKPPQNWFRPVVELRIYGSNPGSKSLFPRNYFEEAPFSWGGWLELYGFVVGFLFFCYLPMWFFVLPGLRRHRLLDPISIWLSLAFFSILICPTAYPFYSFHRWGLMMVFPFSVYYTDGLLKILDRVRSAEANKVALASVLALNAFLGLGYTTGNASYISVSVARFFMPGKMLLSTVEVHRIDMCRACLMWLNENADENSVLVAEKRFSYWAMNWLDERIAIALYDHGILLEEVDLEPVISSYEHVYLIWYSQEEISWHGHEFREIYRCGDISIYELL